MENNKRICIVINDTCSTHHEVQKTLASSGNKIEIISQADAEKQGIALSISEDKGAKIHFGCILYPSHLVSCTYLSSPEKKNKKQRRKGDARYRNG